MGREEVKRWKERKTENAERSLPGRVVTTGKRWPSRRGSGVRTGGHRSWTPCWFRGRTQVLHLFTIKLSSTWDHFPVYVVILKGEERRCYVKKRKGVGGMAATRRRCKQEWDSKRKVIQSKGDARKVEEGRRKKRLSGDNSKKHRGRGKEIAHTTKLERDRDARRVPTKIVAQERPATRSLRPVENRVLRRQARRAREQRT